MASQILIRLHQRGYVGDLCHRGRRSDVQLITKVHPSERDHIIMGVNIKEPPIALLPLQYLIIPAV